MKIPYSLVVGAWLFLLAASGSAADRSPLQGAQLNSVRWYSGYTMPSLLESDVHVNAVSDVGMLLRKKWYSSFSVMMEGGRKIKLSTCDDYFSIAGRKVSVVHEKDASPFMEVVAMCYATREIAHAHAASHASYLPLVFNRKLPDVLPAAVAMIVSTSERKRVLGNKKIKTLSQAERIESFKKLSLHNAIYHYAGGTQELALVASGDFNCDGVEDYLISSANTADGGSYAAFRLFLLTSKPGVDHFLLLKQF
jgi:hypothetical protein